MNTFFKYFFTILFLLIFNIQTNIFGNYETALQERKISLIKQHHTHYKFKKQGNSFLQEWIWRQPGTTFLGLTWTNIVRKYSENRKNDQLEGQNFPISTTELCLKTKVLLGALVLAPVAGLGYYFNWFKRK